MIACSASEQAERYLSELSSTSQDELFKELNECDKGMPPLHQAVANADLNMVKVLLSFDASTEAKVQEKSVEEYAKELMESYPRDDRFKWIYALVKSRGRWQSTIAKEQGLLFSRSMKAVEDMVDKIEGVAEQIGFLFFGATGEGKSTFVNYLTGVNYEPQVTNGIKQVIPLRREIVRTGNSTTSETLYPQVIKWKNQQVLVDLAGFGDTRGTTEEICAAASITLLTKQLHAIQSLFLVCSWDSLKDSRMLKYREAAHHIGTMISADLRTAENVILVITKPKSKTTVEFVKQRLLDLKRAENWSNLKQINRNEVSEDIWKKYCLKNVTEAILSSEERILLTDVTTYKARETFQKAVDDLETQFKSPSRFDFCNYSRFLERFKKILIKHMQHYIEMVYQHNDLSQLLDKKNSTLSETKSKMVMLNNEYAQLYQWCHTPFDSGPNFLSIKKMKEEISNQKTFLYSCYTSKQESEELMRTKRNKLVFLEATNDRNVIVFEGTNLPGVSVVQIAKSELLMKTTSDYYEYVLFVENQRSHYGRLDQEAWNELSRWFKDRYERNFSLYIYNNTAKNEKYIKETDIKRLKKEMQEIQETIANIQQSIWNSEDRIRQEECNIIAEENKMAYAKAAHETQIAIYYARAMEIYKWIMKLNADMTILLSEQEKIRQDIHSCEMEQTVNEDLFSKIYTITQVLGFNDDTVNIFNSLFNQKMEYVKNDS